MVCIGSYIVENAHEFTARRLSLTPYQSGATNTSRMLPSWTVMRNLIMFSYDSLKKCIYQLEKQQHSYEQLLTYDPESDERSTLLAGQDASTDAMFIPLLDRQLRKIVTFYEQQEKELINDLEVLEKSLLEQEDVGLGRRYYDDLTDDDDDDSIEESFSPVGRRQPTNHQRRHSRSGRRLSTSALLTLCRTLTQQSHTFHFVARSRPLSESPVRHRTSISSLEDIHAEPDGSPKPPKTTFGTLSNTFNNLRESLSSAHDPDHTVWTARSDYAYDIRLLFKRRIRNLYIAFTNLRSYVEANFSGFRKIVKKYVVNMSFYLSSMISAIAITSVGLASHNCLDFNDMSSHGRAGVRRHKLTSAVGSLSLPV